MTSPSYPLPPPPIPYQYNRDDVSIRGAGDPSQLYMALEHLRLRSQRLVPRRGRATMLIVGGCILGVSVLSRVFVSFAQDSPDLQPLAIGASLFGGLGFLVGLIVSVIGLTALNATELHQPDPEVNVVVYLPPELGGLLRGLAPALYDATLGLNIPESAGPMKPDHTREFSFFVHAQAGWEAGIRAARHVAISSYRTGNTQRTTTRSWHETTFTVRPPQLPADIAARIDAVGPATFPQFAHASPVEVALEHGVVRMKLKSSEPPSHLMLVSYTNALAYLAAFPAPVFTG